MFNCYNRRDRRTNNDLEGWHIKIQKKLPYRNHSNLWTFINGLKLIDHNASLEEIQIDNGLEITSRIKSYRLKEESLKSMHRMDVNNQYISDIDYIISLSKLMIELR